MTRRLTALALALVLALSLTGCWEAEPEPEPDDFWNDDLPSPSEEEPQRAPAQISDFTLPYLSGQTFDPVTCIDGVQQTVGALLYEPLFTLDASFTPQPVLCEHSSYDAQALTWTFALRSAVFSDGTALTANDVLAAYRRAAESARYGARFANVASMKERPRSARHRPLRLHNSSRRRGADRKFPLARQLSAARAHCARRGQGQRYCAEPVRLP